MIPDRPDRVPDAIEPLTGYRSWYFDREGTLFPIGGMRAAPTSAWEGAHRHWVSASCYVVDPRRALASVGGVSRDGVWRCLQKVYEKLGSSLDAESFADPHAVPGEGCSCGFYAMKTLGAVTEPRGPNVILGRVELAGKVIECTDGYRAERARIAELIPTKGNVRAAKRLARDLGLPLTFFPEWTYEHRRLGR